MSGDLAWIAAQYGVPAEKGRRVTFRGEPGVITSAHLQYLMIRMDSGALVGPCHPTWHIDYDPCEARP
jgi:hypothetical protein